MGMGFPCESQGNCPMGWDGMAQWTWYQFPVTLSREIHVCGQVAKLVHIENTKNCKILYLIAR